MLEDARPRVLLTQRALRGSCRRLTRTAVRAAWTRGRPLDAPARHAAACSGACPRQPGLRHLHLRLHRPAQGRADRAPRRCAPACMAPATRTSARARRRCSSRPSPSTPPCCELWGPLLHGGRLVRASRRESRRRPGTRCAACSSGTRVTVAAPAPPACFAQLVDATEPRPAGAARTCISGGDGVSAPPRAPRRWSPLPRAGQPATAPPRPPSSPPATLLDAGRTAGRRRCPSAGPSPTPRLYVLDARPAAGARGRARRAVRRRRRPGARLPAAGRS